MQTADMQLMFQYNSWANRRILKHTADLTHEQYTAKTGFPRGSLRATLLHVLDAEYGWRMLLTEAREVEDLTETDYPTLPALQRRWDEEEALMRAFLAGLADTQMAEIVRYTNTHGVKRERVLWQCLFHVVNHGTQHRSEVAAILTDLGHSPGDIDFSVFQIEHRHSTS